MHEIARDHYACIGHRIPGHDGKCKYLHGHNYKFTFVIRAPRLDKDGMLVDFGNIKDTLCAWIDDNWDHKTLIWEQDPILNKTWFEKKRNRDRYGIVRVPFCPTAEEISKYLVVRIGPKVFNECSGKYLNKCIVQETEKCSASYTLEGS